MYFVLLLLLLSDAHSYFLVVFKRTREIIFLIVSDGEMLTNFIKHFLSFCRSLHITHRTLNI